MTKQALLRRWNELWDACGVRKGGRSGHFDRLYVHYAAATRGYHGVGHLEYGLGVFDKFKHLAHWPLMVEASWWGHDVIYNGKPGEDELQSAQYMDALYQALGLISPFRTAGFGCIMATTHAETQTDRDRQFICDIDLSPLGTRSWEEACRNTRGIRKEYAHVPKEVFIEKRREILTLFKGRDSLFYLPEFRDEFDAQAKENLAREIEELPKIIANVP